MHIFAFITGSISNVWVGAPSDMRDADQSRNWWHPTFRGVYPVLSFCYRLKAHALLPGFFWAILAACAQSSFRFFGLEVILPETVDSMVVDWLELIFSPRRKVRKVFHLLLLRDTIEFCRPWTNKFAIWHVLLILGPWGGRRWWLSVDVIQN